MTESSTSSSDLLPVELAGGLVINFRRIRGGAFRMGARGVLHFEEPTHRVAIEHDFYLAEFPTTQAQFAVWTDSQEYGKWFAANESIIRETSPQGVAEPHRNHFASDGLRPQHPAENVTWWEARAFADWLTGCVVLPDGWMADLPTESQWEYACRAGTESAYWCGEREEDLAQVGWYAENSDGETKPVGELRANPWGLYDMHGNVSEWCLDYYDARRYRKLVESRSCPAVANADEVEPEGANPTFVAWAEMMGRYSAEDDESRRVLPADRSWLESLSSWVDGFPDHDSWKQAGIHIAAKHALKPEHGIWPDRNLATQLRPLFQSWVDAAESSESPARVLRGGAYGESAVICRSAYRVRYAPGNRGRNNGFRLALVPGPVQPAKQAEPTAGGRARRDDAASTPAGGGAVVAPKEVDDESRAVTREGVMKSTKSRVGELERAISSVDGRQWWGEDVPFPFPAEGAPDPTVKRVALGSLEQGKELTLDDRTLDGLKRLSTHFPRLTHIHLWGLTNLEQVDGLPDSLECLDVRKCPGLKAIGSLPDSARLKTVDLGECPSISKLPPGGLSELEFVWLDGCSRLEHFAPLRPALSSIRHLELHGCRFRDLDTAYCGVAKENVIDKVRSYFRAGQEQGTESVAECKVIVLGNGGVGKTELVRSLKNLPFNSKQDSTDGIRLWKWDGDGFAPFPEEGVDTLALNIWDFGGQDLYHNTHRMFLQNRAVFVIVEREQPKGKPFRPEHPEDHPRPLDYWLDQVYAANPHPRVIVVRTGIDITEQVEPLKPWQERVRSEYRGLDYFEVSSQDRKPEQWGPLREKLLAQVRDELRGADAVQMPKGRAAVRRELARWQPSWDEGVDEVDSERPVLRRHEFVELASEAYRNVGLPEPDDNEIRFQLDHFHFSGAVYAPPQWMEEASSPDAYPVIVDQRWVIEGIYELIVMGSDAREVIVSMNGDVTSQDLEEAWGNIRNDGHEARYDQLAQWVMQKYMQASGLLVERGDKMVMPEFLLPLHRLRRGAGNDSLVTATSDGTASRTYVMRHRSLGQGFGCLLVGLMARHFGKVPLFRYGAAAPVSVGDAYAGGEQQVPVLVQWYRENEDAFQGDISVQIFGSDETDGDVLDFLGSLIRTMPEFPRDVQFEALDGTPSIAPLRSVKIVPASMPVRASARAQVRLGIVGLSIAGEDAANPGIEVWPQVIERGLAAALGHDVGVLCYKRDEERQMLGELIQDLAQSDLMIAVIGGKYLHSEYCMVEFLKAARWWSRHLAGAQPQHDADDTWLGEPEVWANRLWWVTLPDADPLLARPDQEGYDQGAINAWKSHWLTRGLAYEQEVGGKYGGKKNARKLAPREFVYDEWMRFACAGQEGLEAIRAAISTRRLRHLRLQPVPTGFDQQAADAWADELAEPFVKSVAEQMKKILGSQSREQKRQRFAEIASEEWVRGREDFAADLFDRVLEMCDDPAQATRDALTGTLPEGCGKLEPIRDFWLRRSGKSSSG